MAVAKLQSRMRSIPQSTSVLTSASERSSMTSAYICRFETLCKEGRLDQVLPLLVDMDHQGSVPSVNMYQSLLQLCTKKKALAEAKHIHAHLAKHGLESNEFLGDLMTTTLIKCGSFSDGLQLFRRLSKRTVYSWTAIISGYDSSGQSRKALSCYEQMHQEGVQPNNYTFVSLLKACSRLEDLEEGRRIHADARKYGFESDIYVGSTLVNMYGKCGNIMEARRVFDGLSQRTVVSWNAMLAAYAQHDQGQKALDIYQQMQAEGVRPDVRTFVSAVQACGSLAELEQSALVEGENVKVVFLREGRNVHARAKERGFDADVFLGSSLVSMYAKCGSVKDAAQVFGRLSKRNVVTWTAMIAAYVQQNQGDKALETFLKMKEEQVTPNQQTFVSVLQACSSLAEQEGIALVDGLTIKAKALQKGRELHAAAADRGFDSDMFVASTLISMYAKCGSFREAEQVFNSLSHPTVVIWNAMIAACAQHHHAEKAWQLFVQMQDEGIRPNARTLVSLLLACASFEEKKDAALVDGQTVSVEALERVREIHSLALKENFASDKFLGSSLINTYAKCGSIQEAEQVFERLSNRNVVSWNAMIAAYAQQDQGENALELFAQMEVQGVRANEATLLSVLKACSSTGALDTCARIHRTLVGGDLEFNVTVATSLIQAYGKCGNMVEAQRVFDLLPQPDLVSWNALLAGYAGLGSSEMSMQRFEQMRQTGVKPDRVTFLALLTSCSHAGMVAKGLEYFECMTRDHGIPPELEHYSCMIDLFGRAGLLLKAEELLMQMPMQPDLPVWLCLLGACRKHGDVVLAKRAFDGAVGVDPKHASAYTLMSNIYSHAGMQQCAREVDELRQKSVVRKQPGQSWLEQDQKVHRFQAGVCRREDELLYGLLEGLCSRLKDSGFSSA